jgi:hypothetical protein
MPASDPLDVVQRVLQILDDGSFTTTYKLAVMLALVELCFEEAAVPGPTGAVLTTPQLADKVLELYWLQVRAYGPRGQDGLLQQSNNAPHQVGGRTLPVLIAHWQASVGAGTTTLPFPVARRRPEFAALRDEVERVLIRMPLPKLQRVGGVHVPLLYEITWDDEPAPTDARLRRYQQTGTGFDNRSMIHDPLRVARRAVRPEAGVARPHATTRGSAVGLAPWSRAGLPRRARSGAVNHAPGIESWASCGSNMVRS